MELNFADVTHQTWRAFVAARLGLSQEVLGVLALEGGRGAGQRQSPEESQSQGAQQPHLG